MITTTDFLILVAIALAGVCIWLGWIAWPRRKKKVDTSKVDAEIDKLLDLDDYEIKTYHHE